MLLNLDPAAGHRRLQRRPRTTSPKPGLDLAICIFCYLFWGLGYLYLQNYQRFFFALALPVLSVGISGPLIEGGDFTLRSFFGWTFFMTAAAIATAFDAWALARSHTTSVPARRLRLQQNPNPPKVPRTAGRQRQETAQSRKHKGHQGH